MLNMGTVRPADSVDWSGAVKIRLLMFSGVEILADTAEVDGEYLLRLRASHPAADVVNSQTEDKQDSITQQDIDQRAAEDVAKTVQNINQKVVGWAYGINKQNYDAMVKKPDDLLKPLESP
jgi:hypothetical protein